MIAENPATARHFLRVVTQRLRAADEMLSRLQIKNPNEEMDERLTFGERIADAVSRFGGSWTFIMLFFFFLLAWAADQVRPQVHFRDAGGARRSQNRTTPLDFI